MRLPDFAAEDATRRFNDGLYVEHLEEASFLYEQRRSLYDDPKVTWVAIGEFERRFEAHLDALVSGGTAALEICRRQADGESAELYAAVCVFCRGGRRDLLGAVLKRLDPDNAERSQAVSEALKDEMPADWGLALAASLSRGYDKFIPITARYLGYRRLAAGGALDRLIIDQVPGRSLAQLLWAWGRVGDVAVAPHVTGYAGHADAEVRSNAVMALLRRGDDRALAACRQRASRGDQAMYLPLAVGGRRSDAALLQNLAQITPGSLIALGVLGDLSTVRFLVDRLADQDLGAAAATALQLITGANLREEAFIPEVVNEDELFEDELEVYRATGEGPKHPDDRPFGANVERTSRNPDEWHDWLGEQKSQFDSTRRYRLGKPFSLGSLVDTLVSPSFGRQVRSLAYEELVVRYGIDIAFETEMRVSEQKKQINAIARLCRSREASFRPGQWYFAGA